MTRLLDRPTALPGLDDLRAALRGPVVAPGDPDYGAVRAIWNAAVDRRPGAIARCTSAADVIRALRFARERDLTVAVRGGGHNVAGSALCEGGLVIDLQLMRGLRVDPGRRELLAQPGLRLADVDHETEAFGLALASGINSETGLAGLALGGGIGWQMRSRGLTIDQLLAADVVTADGQLLHASAAENPELFWAIRGGGGNFGIVTAFEFRLVELGPPVCGGVVLYPAEQAGSVLRAYRRWASDVPNEVTTILIFRNNAFRWAPEGTQGRPVLGVGALYSGPAENGRGLLAPLEEFGPVLASSVETRRFTEHQAMLDASSPAGRLYYWKSHYMHGLTDAAIDVIADYAWRSTSPASFALLAHMGGAIKNHAEAATAFSGRDAEFTININCAATDMALYEADRAWVKEWFDALVSHSTGGAYINFVGDEGSEGVRAAYGAKKLRRLAMVKAKLDPDNVFRTNQNIAPA